MFYLINNTMSRKILMLSGLLVALSLAVSPVFAQDGVGVTSSTSTKAVTRAAEVASKIACVASAVSVREAALGAAFSTHSASVQAAYATRANELAGAYSNTTADKVRPGVKVAWEDFNRSVKNAKSAWKTSRDAAWTAFRSAAKACKVPSGVSDSAHSDSEPSGQ